MVANDAIEGTDSFFPPLSKEFNQKAHFSVLGIPSCQSFVLTQPFQRWDWGQSSLRFSVSVGNE